MDLLLLSSDVCIVSSSHNHIIKKKKKPFICVLQKFFCILFNSCVKLIKYSSHSVIVLIRHHLKYSIYHCHDFKESLKKKPCDIKIAIKLITFLTYHHQIITSFLRNVEQMLSFFLYLLDQRILQFDGLFLYLILLNACLMKSSMTYSNIKITCTYFLNRDGWWWWWWWKYMDISFNFAFFIVLHYFIRWKITISLAKFYAILFILFHSQLFHVLPIKFEANFSHFIITLIVIVRYSFVYLFYCANILNFIWHHNRFVKFFFSFVCVTHTRWRENFYYIYFLLTCSVLLFIGNLILVYSCFHFFIHRF